jgi:hypothetical protein
MNLADYIDHFRARVLQDALDEATAEYWHRRAAAFDAARPRVGDFTGNATAEETAQRDLRLSAYAVTCRQRAAVAILCGEAVPRNAGT